MKKLLNIILVLIMMLTVVPVNAATGTGSITITKATSNNDVSYDLYRLFDVEYDSTNNTQVYFLNSKYASLFQTGGALASYVTLSTETNNEGRTYVKAVTFSTDAETKAFTKAALAAVKAANLAADKTATIAAADTTTTVSGLTYGYWLVDSSLGSIVSINTTKPDAAINDKNSDTIPEKTTPNINNVKIGETVNYKVVVEVKEGAQNYVLTDTMTRGLTYTGTYYVSIYDTKDAADAALAGVAGTNPVAASESTYAYTAGTAKANGTDVQFTINFNNAYVTSIEGKYIVVTYTATTNEEAVTVDTVNNKATLTFGDNNTVDSTPTETKLYRFAINKIADDENATKLGGAKFKLYDAESNGNEIPVIAVKNAAGEVLYYRPTLAGETAEEIVTKDNGSAEVRGLANTTYYVEETKAPENYVKLTKRVKVTVVEQKEGTDVATTSLSTVVNTKTVLLPSTGGMGTVMFVLVGSIMAIGMGVMLVTKFRMSKELA